jgi:hypothetical protein
MPGTAATAAAAGAPPRGLQRGGPSGRLRLGGERRDEENKDEREGAAAVRLMACPLWRPGSEAALSVLEP